MKTLVVAGQEPMATTALGPQDLVVDGLDGVDGVVGDGAGDAENVGVARAAFKTHAQLLRVVARGEAGDQLDVAAVATARVHMEEPGAVAAGVAHQFVPELHSLPHLIDVEQAGPDAGSEDERDQQDDGGFQEEWLLWLRVGSWR